MAKENNNTVPEGFTVSMATVDLIPVLLFSASVAVLASRFGSVLFLIGAVLVILSGLLQCVWKYIVAIRQQNIAPLHKQMMVGMPLGFLLMILSLILDRDKMSWSAVGQQILSFPSLLFYLLGILLLIAMSVFAVKLDENSAKHNWIEQGTNSLAQLMILLGILF